MMVSKMAIFSDGGSRGNPGPGACAFVVKKGDQTIGQGSKYLGKVTNNFAEYSGVLIALNWLIDNLSQVDEVKIFDFFMDSELVVNQINGNYRIKNPSLKNLYGEIRKLIDKKKFQIFFKSIPRSKNKFADSLVNQELDNHSVL